MSLICLNNKSIISKLNPSFPVINSLKWRTQTSWSSSNTITLISPSTKLFRTSCTAIHKTNDYVTRDVGTTTQGETMSELEAALPKGWFWFRKWHSEDMANVFWYAVIHVLAVCAPFMFTWGAFWVATGLSFLTGFGVTLGYHRLLCHRSFKVPKWLEYFFVYCGAHAFQKDPLFYVNTHKNHHKYADTDRDPVAPTHGFWYCNMGWFCNNHHIAAKCGESKGGEYSKVPELKAQWLYRFLHDTYYWHPTALAALLYLHGGLSYLAWGMGMRGVVVHHFASLATFVSHIWGDRPWNTPDTSTNNWWVAMLTLGEGWHNNHHAFPRSARHGFEWWQFDLTWELIKFLKLVGLARDVKLPTEAEKRRMSVKLKIKGKVE
ncbi:putative fatty acid desaturase domain, acyl-CoA desaturase [Helianthus annuus]|uniref:Acyl-CoA desaturase n=1 Tax=Helianthus annuus TaxID=4232 RepID=A0A251TI98_HELAN|nr:delta-9 acyl-lipid desaturase 1 [Helianthus annuus]KAF5785350.1 putative acyl-CoA desaturase [Helianthus annuus]KAJ0520624.1 putative fatty acid desaturase domain, acyl-CoA desaturase [Helianthus annuus]KAJ0878496.1 putative fatty acid desaturase domain, acyl-CoA desaturase [Helianthus annuus]KAJ0882731.1 putative acyl-CoA desaturase [Helianthus annuus]